MIQMSIVVRDAGDRSSSIDLDVNMSSLQGILRLGVGEDAATRFASQAERLELDQAIVNWLAHRIVVLEGSGESAYRLGFWINATDTCRLSGLVLPLDPVRIIASEVTGASASNPDHVVGAAATVTSVLHPGILGMY